jgi:hypothetical protein
VVVARRRLATCFLVCSARKLGPVISTKWGPVGQPIERGRGEQRLAEEVRPLGPVAVRGQQNGGLLIAFVDDVVEVLGAGRAEGLQAEIVKDQQGGAGVAGEAVLVGAVGAAPGEVAEHLVGGHAEDLIAAATGFVGEGLRHVALAHAGRAVHQDRFMARDELTGGEVKDLGLVELGVEAEVEAFEGLGGIEGGAAQAQPERALGAALDLVLQERGEEVDEGGLLLDGLTIPDVERLEDAGQAQGAEHWGELMGQFHEADLLSSGPGSGKKVVQGRTWRGGTAGAAGGVKAAGSGC